MNKVFFPVLLLFLFSCADKKSEFNAENHTTVFEKSEGLRSADYHEGIQWWKDISKASAQVQLLEFGETDAGYPLHLAILSQNPIQLEEIKFSNKSCILINNAIHPGEPDGVDASMMLFRDLVASQNEVLDSVILVCIPYYNVGGSLNRNSHSRTNQEGPEEYGFRGNAQNLDLNRDFIKCDSRNARSFAQLLQVLDPDVYVETHVSNGADYQYSMTYLSTQPDKLGYGMGEYLSDEFIPQLEKGMEEKEDAMVPYVNIHGSALDSAYDAFYDSPRYSTGLTTLHQIFGFITETHMLKPFDQRVRSTYNFLETLIHNTAKSNSKLQKLREEAKKEVASTPSYALDWEKDTSSFRSLTFNGYEYSYQTSEVTGQPRLKYHRDQPKLIDMKYYHKMNGINKREKPKFYILKAGYHAVADLLRDNGVVFETLEQDTTLNVISYKIENFETNTSTYEKHYFHYNTSFSRDTMEVKFVAGDYLIPLGTDKDRFLVELLEPDGPDSYFNWNFFDAVLQQKEWYSAYVFEDKAAEYLAKDTALKSEFETMKNETPGFSENVQWQLYWIYKHTPHYEKEHMRLPVYRIE
ncbi:M14 family metallopeptidase [bacterium]|nr:M14 family metallopeptidase [bacterium]